jgi:hypothetical protein
MSLNNDAHLAPGAQVHSRRFDSELVLLDLARGEYYALDPMGARVWETLASGSSLGEVCDALLPEYDVDERQLRADLLSFVEGLVSQGLMRVAE